MEDGFNSGQAEIDESGRVTSADERVSAKVGFCGLEKLERAPHIMCRSTRPTWPPASLSKTLPAVAASAALDRKRIG